MLRKTGFNVAHCVIAKIPCETPAKTGQAGWNGYLKALKVRIDKIQWVVVVGLDNLTVCDHFGGGRNWSANRAENGFCWKANK